MTKGLALPSASKHVAIVTGANHGIGAATAERLAAGGVAVLVAFLRSSVRSDLQYCVDGGCPCPNGQSPAEGGICFL